MQWRRGVYYADIGDFASAGAFDIRYFDTLPNGIATATIGSLGFVRGLVADSPKLGNGNLLYAFEYEHNDGPWRNPDDFGKYNGVLKYSTGDALNGFTLTLLGYHGDWNATDQSPRRAFERGLGRLDGIEDTTGGDSNRASLLADWYRGDQFAMTRLLVSGSYYDLDLFRAAATASNSPTNTSPRNGSRSISTSPSRTPAFASALPKASTSPAPSKP